MSGTTIAVISSLNNATFVRSQNQVNKIAQQGIEYVRDQVVNNNQFTTYTTAPYNGSTRCMNPDYGMATVVSTLSIPQSFCTTLIDGKYIRTVYFLASRCTGVTNDFANGLLTTVRVYWRDSKCPNGSTNYYCHSQDVSSCFVNPTKQLPTTVPTGI